MTETAEATTDPLYTEVAGCTCYIGGQRGVTTGFTYSPGLSGPEMNGAFVKLDEGDRPMLYVTLGAPVSGDNARMTHREVLAWREISRDGFDSLTGLADARRKMGWR
ncbi:hypothetical protein N1031_06830 [Herbiconiux moechotypicola]|uniref:Uncharacterized protein n=1 Tax=Herbiconiux moechotypicola TaxID=637393 RepID=A0ABN3DG49_9MICO|nr:hypothetical protein [Herbiconiux moechotypicola]MCS5729472.1 hypothetical protein [Herbiconiux moechotypicola]